MNWIELKALHQLSISNEVLLNATLEESSVFRYLTESLGVMEMTAKKAITQEDYARIYQENYAALFKRYLDFLSSNQLLKPQTRFELEDIEILIGISAGMANGDLKELREQIIAADESLRGVSLMFFKNEKYLLGKPSLVEALKQILRVTHFSIEKDQQYIYKLECNNPAAIVLCENLDFLTKPNKPRQFGIELWYSGGKNVQKLIYSDNRGLPVYYSCDWDYDGLLIYTWITAIIPNIELLTPNGVPRDIIKTGHNSEWRNRNDPDTLSGLDPKLFTANQRQQLKQLIANNQWVVEESNDLISMMKQQPILK